MRVLLWCIVVFFGAASALAVDGVDLPGHDYARYTAPSALTCRHSCGGEPECQAYTWVRPGVQGPDAICYLKNIEPAIVKNGCCDSGPRRFIESSENTVEPAIDRRVRTSGISRPTADHMIGPSARPPAAETRPAGHGPMFDAVFKGRTGSAG